MLLYRIAYAESRTSYSILIDSEKQRVDHSRRECGVKVAHLKLFCVFFYIYSPFPSPPGLRRLPEFRDTEQFCDAMKELGVPFDQLMNILEPPANEAAAAAGDRRVACCSDEDEGEAEVGGNISTTRNFKKVQNREPPYEREGWSL